MKYFKNLKFLPSDQSMKMTDEQLQKAFGLFCSFLGTFKEEIKLQQLLEIDSNVFSNANGNWLHYARTRLFLSLREVAQQLSISPAGYAKFEKSEIEGTISIKTLKKAAEAMDCELVYFIRPKNRFGLTYQVWKKLIPLVLRYPQLKRNPPVKWPTAVARMAVRLLEDPDFRKARGLKNRLENPIL